MLKNLTLTLLLFSLSCSVTVAQTNRRATAPSWRTFTPEGKEFSVEFPGQPAHRADHKSEPGISMTFHLYHLSTNSEVYAIGYVDVPPSLMNTDERLEFGVSYAAEIFISQGGKEISRRKFTSSFGCPGIIWTGSNPKIPVFEVRAFGTPKRVYVIFCLSSNSGQAPRDAFNRFVNSFKVAGSPCGDKEPN